MTVAANRLKGARLVRVNSRPRQLWDESPLWVESGDWAWPLILAGEAIAAPLSHALACGRIRILVTGGATGAFSASLRVRKMR